MIFFPECFDYIGRSKAETVEMAMAETSPFIQSFRDLAKEHSVWLSLGGFHHKVYFWKELFIQQSGSLSGSKERQNQGLNIVKLFCF